MMGHIDAERRGLTMAQRMLRDMLGFGMITSRAAKLRLPWLPWRGARRDTCSTNDIKAPGVPERPTPCGGHRRSNGATCVLHCIV
jgi:hypothetical protein